MKNKHINGWIIVLLTKALKQVLIKIRMKTLAWVVKEVDKGQFDDR